MEDVLVCGRVPFNAKLTQSWQLQLNLDTASSAITDMRPYFRGMTHHVALTQLCCLSVNE